MPNPESTESWILKHLKRNGPRKSSCICEAALATHTAKSIRAKLSGMVKDKRLISKITDEVNNGQPVRIYALPEQRLALNPVRYNGEENLAAMQAMARANLGVVPTYFERLVNS